MQSTQRIAGETGDRRLHQRVMAPERALVAISEDYFSLPYNLADISEGGMAFRHINNSSFPLTECQMDIYLNEDLQISRLPVTVVSDQHLDDSFKIKRRCSVCFGELTEDQRWQLRAFINRPAAKAK